MRRRPAVRRGYLARGRRILTRQTTVRTYPPAVNESKLKDLDLPAKTAAGPVQGTITVDDRDFGYAAARAPSLGGDMGIAVMRSEL